MNDLNKSQIITPQLVSHLRERFELNWNGIHGASHWSRVRLNGLLLSKISGADSSVIEYFAVLHDVCRESDGHDPEHGKRAAEFARKAIRDLILLEDEKFEFLTQAMEGHTGGVNHPSLIVETCWDADRLDIGRVGNEPYPQYLCTAAAKNKKLIAAALARSNAWLEQQDRAQSK